MLPNPPWVLCLSLSTSLAALVLPLVAVEQHEQRGLELLTTQLMLGCYEEAGQTLRFALGSSGHHVAHHWRLLLLEGRPATLLAMAPLLGGLPAALHDAKPLGGVWPTVEQIGLQLAMPRPVLEGSMISLRIDKQAKKLLAAVLLLEDQAPPAWRLVVACCLLDIPAASKAIEAEPSLLGTFQECPAEWEPFVNKVLKI